MSSEIFKIERNDDCLCGSGKKYKKCCLPKVEKIKAGLIEAIGNKVTVTAEGREFLRIICVMYGIDLDADDAKVDTERLAETILHAWDEEERIIIGKSEEFMEKIEKILREKKGMKFVRIPGSLMIELDDDTDDEEIEDTMLEIIESLQPEDYLLEVAYSLRTDEYTEEEIKNVFHWISLGLLSDFAHGFMLPILHASLKEINEAKEKVKKIIDGKDELDEDDGNRIDRVYAEYPIFAEYMGAKLMEDVQDDLNEVLNGRLSFRFPLYTVYAFFLKFFAATVNMLGGIIKGNSLDYSDDVINYFSDAADELLAEEVIFEKVFECIYDTVAEAEQNADDEAFKEKLSKIREFLSFFSFELFFAIKDIFLKSISGYFKSLPQPVDDSGITINSIDDILKPEFFEQYVSYLESKGLTKEADYLKGLYSEIEEKSIPDIVKNILNNEN